MSEQIDQFFRPDGTLISIPVKPAQQQRIGLGSSHKLIQSLNRPWLSESIN